jgi:hypothetical protein
LRNATASQVVYKRFQSIAPEICGSEEAIKDGATDLNQQFFDLIPVGLTFWKEVDGRRQMNCAELLSF